MVDVRDRHDIRSLGFLDACEMPVAFLFEKLMNFVVCKCADHLEKQYVCVWVVPRGLGQSFAGHTSHGAFVIKSWFTTRSSPQRAKCGGDAGEKFTPPCLPTGTLAKIGAVDYGMGGADEYAPEIEELFVC